MPAAVDDPAVRRYLELTQDVLPRRGRDEGWVVAHDHCFQRIVLDNVTGGVWYDHVAGRPAFRHLTAEQARAAATLAETIDREGDWLLRQLNERSLSWRRRRRARGGPPSRGPAARGG